MCLTQQNQQTVLISAQIQQQSLNFLQRHKSALDDFSLGDSDSDDDDDDFDPATILALPDAFKQGALFQGFADDEAEESVIDDRKPSAAGDVPPLEPNGSVPLSLLKRVQSAQSLSDMTNFSEASQCETVNTGFFGEDSASVAEIRKTTIKCKSPQTLMSDSHVVSSSSGCSDNDEDSSVESSSSEGEADWERLVGDMDRDALQLSFPAAPAVDESKVKKQPKEHLQSHMGCMKISHDSQVELQKWDAKMGLRRCHCKTMMDTSASRKALLEVMGVFVEDYEPPVVRRPRIKRKSPDSTACGSGIAKPKSQGSLLKKLKMLPTLYNPIA